MNIVSLALRNLARRPLRSMLSILGVGLAVGSALALVTLSRSIQESSRESAEEMGDDLVVMQKGASDIFGGFIPEETVDKVAALPGIVRASGELFTFAPGGEDRSVLTLGWPDGSYLWGKVPIGAGRMPRPGERHVVVLGQAIARTLNAAVGTDIRLFDDDYRVVAIANYTSAMNRNLAMVPLKDLQDASYRPRQVSMVHVSVDRGRGDVAHAKERIEAIGNVSATAPDDVLRKDRNFAILDAVSLAVSIIAIAIGALNVLNALVIATQERTREIGILAAIGWTDRRIIASLVVEGLTMCAIGCVVGLGLSFLSAFAFPLLPAIGNLIAFRPSPQLVLVVFAASFVLCALGSLVPAWRAVQLMPAEALRRL